MFCFRWNETGKSRKFLKVIVNKFAYPDYRLISDVFGPKLSKFIDEYKEDIPDFLQKVRTEINSLHIEGFKIKDLNMLQNVKGLSPKFVLL